MTSELNASFKGKSIPKAWWELVSSLHAGIAVRQYIRPYKVFYCSVQICIPFNPSKRERD